MLAPTDTAFAQRNRIVAASRFMWTVCLAEFAARAGVYSGMSLPQIVLSVSFFTLNIGLLAGLYFSRRWAIWCLAILNGLSIFSLIEFFVPIASNRRHWFNAVDEVMSFLLFVYLAYQLFKTKLKTSIA